MRILLINCPNRLARQPEFFPYGLGILASVLKKAGHTVHIFDANLHRDMNLIAQYVSETGPWHVVGLSGLITTYGYQKQIAQMLRQKLPDALIISGGGLATGVPELLVKKTEIQVACVNEGESIVDHLVNVWSDNRDLNLVRGIFWKADDGQTVVKNGDAGLIKNLDQIPFPDWEEAGLKNYFPFSGFGYKGIGASKLVRRADTTTTRGCPYHCSFCFNVFDRDLVRYRSVDNVIEEIKLLKSSYGVDSIDFLDENFCFSRRRVEELCSRLIDEDLNIRWGTAARIDDVDADLLKLMKESGCIFILYGFESGSQRILDRMNKKTTVERAWETFVMTEKAGIDARGNLIIGHPGETLDTMAESLSFQKRRYEFLIGEHPGEFDDLAFREHLERRFATVSFCTPYPGSQIYIDNRQKIGDLEKFLNDITLQDAKKLVVNLTELSIAELLGGQQLLSRPEFWNYPRLFDHARIP